MRSLDAGCLASLPETLRNEILAALTPSQAQRIVYDWPFWARASQLPPAGKWRVWLLLAGRGFGKTRTGAEFISARAARSGRRIAVIGPTTADARDVMVEGESGILTISPPWNRPRFEPSKRRLTWPNGAIATLYSADEPERLRGRQHDTAWCDELGSWRYPEAWDMLMFGLRLGADPCVVVTTTPRPVRLIRELAVDSNVVVTRGRTTENRANLAPGYLEQIVAKYQGTRLGRQELDAELLEDVPGALWNRGVIEAARSSTAPPLLARIVVAIDPAATSGESADETGIIVAGKDGDAGGWILADASGRYQPAEWAKIAIAAYRAHGADRIVAEVNNGGEMVETTLRMVDPNVSFAAVRASRGKITRAEPVAALYEQGRIRHLGCFPQLEDQMCGFTREAHGEAARRSLGHSPDRVDALVWALTDLMVEPMPQEGIYEAYRQLSDRLSGSDRRKP